MISMAYAGSASAHVGTGLPGGIVQRHLQSLQVSVIQRAGRIERHDERTNAEFLAQ